MENIESTPLFLSAKAMADKNSSFDDITNALKAQSSDEELISAIIKKLKKERHELHQKNGIQKLVIGCFLLLTGALVTIVNFHADQSFTYIMYGSSCVGITLVFWGLYEIVG